MIVDVYYNLHKHVWSVRDRATGRVVLHCGRVDLVDVTFRVGQRGRDRVLEEQRKNVHAYVTGRLVNWDSGTVTEAGSVTDVDEYHQRDRLAVFPRFGNPEVTYNPYKYKSFVLKKHPNIRVSATPAVTMRLHQDKGVVFLGTIPPSIKAEWERSA